MEKPDSSLLFRQPMYADKRQWKQFLSIFLLAAGVGFTVAGIIFFFAYNWEDLPKFAKLGIVQTLLVASVLLTVFTRWNILIKQIILTGATFLVGTLLPYSDKSIRQALMRMTYFWAGHCSPSSGQSPSVSLRSGSRLSDCSVLPYGCTLCK